MPALGNVWDNIVDERQTRLENRLSLYSESDFPESIPLPLQAVGEMPKSSAATQLKFDLEGSQLLSLEYDIRSFSRFGSETQAHKQDGIPYFVNEFWTAGQRQAHSIHEVSYRACFKPQLPEFFIDRLTQKNDAVYDPFMGRGTTLVQAALQGRQPVGNDINPLSVLLTRPRLCPPTLSAIEKRLRQIDWTSGEIDRNDLLAFYHPETLQQIASLRLHLLNKAPLNKEPDPVDDWIRMVAINRLTGHSPGFFSVYSLPPNQAVSVASQLKINEKRGQTPPLRDVPKLILKKSKQLLSEGVPPAHPTAIIGTAEAWNTPYIRSGTVKLVVTSPPFLDIVQYAGDNWLRCWFAGINVESVAISHHRNEADWSAMVTSCFEEFARVLCPGGHVAFEVGEVRNGKVLLEQTVWKAVNSLPFERLFVLVNQQEFTKTSNCWGVNNNSKGTNTNRIVVMRRT